MEKWEKEILKIGMKNFAELNLKKFLYYMNPSIEAFTLSYKKAQPILKKIDDEFMKDVKKPALNKQFLAMLSPDFIVTHATKSKVKARLYALRIACHLQIEKIKTGKYPATLDKKFPLDPFSEKPFGYKVLKNGFVLSTAGNKLGRDEKNIKFEFK